MPISLRRAARGALAGGVAAGVWALQQPLDKRAFASSYDDVELLGRLVTREGDGWAAPGAALHVGNGALFGATYALLAPHLPGLPLARGLGMALTEHLALWPMGRVSDRWHPARGKLPVLTGSRRAFWQAAWRHALFGLLLAELERRLNPPVAVAGPSEPAPAAAPDPLAVDGHASRNGHGRLEHAAIEHDAG